MKALRHAACALLTAVSLIAWPAHSTSFSTDQTDLYYVPGESGWGLQLVQRGPLIFATLLVYAAANTPTWYVATLNNSTPGPVNGNTSWTGDLYATTGPYFGTEPFDPAKVAATKVGTMTWLTFMSDNGNLLYDVNGVQVSKSIARQTLVVDDYSGTYMGAIHSTTIRCVDPSLNRISSETTATLAVLQSGPSVVLTLSVDDLVTTVSGTLSQDGQFGAIDGTYDSSATDFGKASIFDMNVQMNALASSFLLTGTSGCQRFGYFAGMRSEP